MIDTTVAGLAAPIGNAHSRGLRIYQNRDRENQGGHVPARFLIPALVRRSQLIGKYEDAAEHPGINRSPRINSW
jgi:hypothetical protein